MRSLGVLLLLAAAVPAAGIDLTVAGGDWNAGIFGPADISGGAGTDLANPTTSAVGQVVLSVGGTTVAWDLRVRKSSGAWPAAMSLAIRRDGDPDWHEITTTDTVFYSGSGSVSNIQCQLRVVKEAGFGAGSFAATLTYTVTEL